MDDLKDIVSKNILFLRTRNKMTQLELGEALNYSDKAVSKWERGESIPDAYVLRELSIIFNVSVDSLLNRYAERELASATPHMVDRRTISFISFLGTWTLATVVFAVLYFLGSLQWLVLVYALPVSNIVLIVLTAIWGKAKANIYFISLAVWSSLAAVYITFIQYNWWLLFIIGLPAQAIVVLSFRVRVKPK